MPGVAIWDLPKGLSSAPVLVTGMGEDFNVKFVGGFVGVQQDPVTLAISPQIGYAVVFDPDLPLPSTGFLEENFPVPTESLPKPATAPTCLDMQQNGVEDGIDCQNADAVTGVRQLCPLCGCVSLWGTGNALLDGSSFIKSHPYYPYYAVYQQETTIAGASLTLRISSYEHVDQWVLYFLQDGVETALFVSQYKGINQIHGMYTALPQTGVTLRDEAGKAITRLQVNHQCNAFNNRTMIDAAIIPQCVVVVRDELVMPSNLAGGQTAVDYRPVYQRYMLVNNLNTAEYGLYYGQFFFHSALICFVGLRIVDHSGFVLPLDVSGEGLDEFSVWLIHIDGGGWCTFSRLLSRRNERPRGHSNLHAAGAYQQLVRG